MQSVECSLSWLCAFCSQRTQVKLDKPVYVGMSVLDLSKTLMYQFFYNTLKARYEDRVRLLYTDTDSLILEFQPEDLYADMATMKEAYDTSNYPVDHPLYDATNKKVVGKFKGELGGKMLTEFVGLRYVFEACPCMSLRDPPLPFRLLAQVTRVPSVDAPS